MFTKTVHIILNKPINPKIAPPPKKKPKAEKDMGWRVGGGYGVGMTAVKYSFFLIHGSSYRNLSCFRAHWSRVALMKIENTISTLAMKQKL